MIRDESMREIICFHNPDEENAYLSNWYLSDFEVDGVRFSSMEQYMMYQKAMTFKDANTAEKIMTESDFAKIKQYGREVSNYDDVVWNGIRQIVVYRGLLAKFTQNEELKRMLKETGDAVLAECAVNDRAWATGISMKDERRFEMDQWRGENLLGFALMQVRQLL